MHHLAGKYKRLTTTALIALAALIGGASFAGAQGPRSNLPARVPPAPSTVTTPPAGELPAAPPTATPPAPGHPANTVTTEPHAAAAISSRPVAFPALACSGPFASDSGNLSLAATFDSRNVIFTEVDGGAIGKVPASVLFPKDPKRRLEVWWSDPASRTRIYLIVINGRSGWIAPRGLRLGQNLAEMEKLNRKPFKLKGFDNDIASVSDWDGGAFADLPGGCKASASLRADPKAPAEAVKALSPDHEYTSADAAVRAIKPTISEILIGY